jgi:hypothetical protein
MSEMEKHMLNIFGLLIENEEFLTAAVKQIHEQYDIPVILAQEFTTFQLMEHMEEKDIVKYVTETMRKEVIDE